MSSRIEQFRSWLYENIGESIGRALIEVFSAILVTFVPIVLLSMNFVSGEQEITADNILNNFLSYFESGELSLVLLAVLGSITALLIINKKLYGLWVFSFSILILIGFLLFVGAIIGSNPGFSKPLQPQALIYILGCYIFSIVMWLYLSVRTHFEIGRAASSSDERAKTLIDRRNARVEDV